jgi:hypothetical protein
MANLFDRFTDYLVTKTGYPSDISWRPGRAESWGAFTRLQKWYFLTRKISIESLFLPNILDVTEWSPRPKLAFLLTLPISIPAIIVGWIVTLVTTLILVLTFGWANAIIHNVLKIKGMKAPQ